MRSPRDRSRLLPTTAIAVAVVASAAGCASHPGLGPYNRGVAHQAAGELPDAIRAYKEAVELEPGLVRARFNLATALERQDKTDRARAEYEAIVETNEHAPSLTNLARIVGAASEDGLARELFARAAEADPDSAYPRVYAGLWHQSAGRLQEASAELEAALEIEPDSALAHFRIGRLREAQGRDDDALAAFRRATAADGDRIEAWIALGRAARRTENTREAIRALQRAFALDLGRDELAKEIGDLHLDAGDPATAIVHYRVVGDDVPGVGEARLVAALRLAIALVPEDDEARAALQARLETAEADAALAGAAFREDAQ